MRRRYKGGLAVSSFASAFVSSTATIGAMGARACRTPELLGAATAGATLSTVATIVQLSAVLEATNLSTMQSLLVPLLCAGGAATIYSATFTIKGMRETAAVDLQLGRALTCPRGFVAGVDALRSYRALSQFAGGVWRNRAGGQRVCSRPR
nr:DUF4010 domain-containing protein [Bradyrhizobium diazoefficiens]